MVRVAAFVLVVMLAASCSGGATTTGSSNPLGDRSMCSDVLQSDQPAARSDYVCVVPPATYLTAEHFACKDGRTLIWNDFAWGYVDDVAHLFPTTTSTSSGTPHPSPPADIKHACSIG